MMSRLLITEATESRILQLTEQVTKITMAENQDPAGLLQLIEEIETDLLHAERIGGNIYEY